MVAQGNIFVLGKTLDFLEWFFICNMLSTFYLFLLPLVFAAWNWGTQAIHYHNLWPQAHGKRRPQLNDIGGIYSSVETWGLGNLFFPRVQA